jgi:hypothetical protein
MAVAAPHQFKNSGVIPAKAGISVIKPIHKQGRFHLL